MALRRFNTASGVHTKTGYELIDPQIPFNPMMEYVHPDDQTQPTFKISLVLFAGKMLLATLVSNREHFSEMTWV